MESWILAAYELLTTMIPFLITFVILSKSNKKKGLSRLWHFLLSCIFAFYILGVFNVTGVGTIYDLVRYGLQFTGEQVNLQPFSRYIDVEAYVLNVIMFMPLGFLLPLIWPNYNRLGEVFLYGVGFSLLIELSQLLNYRSTDIDDLILNTLGAIWGFLLYRLFALIIKRRDKPVEYFKHEAVVYILIMYLGRFLIFNEIGMVKLLYGF